VTGELGRRHEVSGRRGREELLDLVGREPGSLIQQQCSGTRDDGCRLRGARTEEQTIITGDSAFGVVDVDP
jgi:hypothetical protein